MYRIVPDAVVLDQLDSLPEEFLGGYAELLDVLELQPWNGKPQHDKNPDGAVRSWAFGPGSAAFAVYLILEEQREVHIVTIVCNA